MDNEKIKEILKSIGSEELPADVQKIAEKTCGDFAETLTQTKQTKHYILGDYIMKNRLIKLAAAAVIFVVVLAGIQLITETNQVALADVLVKVQQARAFMYRMKMTMTGNMIPGMPTGPAEMDYTVFISDDYGMKLEMEMTDQKTGEKVTSLTYILPDKKIACTISPAIKKYIDIKFDDAMFAKSKQQSNDPRTMIKQMMGSKYTSLGRSVINGVEVEGFHTSDPNFAAGVMEDVDFKLWVDAEKWLPVYAEMDFKMNEQMQMHCVIYDYLWDIPIDASEFEPNIPSDYTSLVEVQPNSGQTSEEKAIEALRMFSEITYGKYPSNLTIVTVMTEAGKALKESGRDPNDKEEVNKMMSNMMNISAASTFYTELLREDKDVVYNGDKVTAEDAGLVLMRWKISEDQYRVIYGDLRAEDVTAERLAKLEEKLQN